MKLVSSKEMKIDLLPDQEDYLCTKETIKEIFERDEKNICLAFDIYMEDLLVGFAMFCEQMKGVFFLWNYAIDVRYQLQGDRHQSIAGSISVHAFPSSCKGLYHHIQPGQ